mmetsp:Transcript_12323/g.10625  ORF Transcript_12323/g.10625 Transcript_12323/m.10625 type:complete len:149 (-) Transcript_12323:234-680(-)
MPSMFYFLMTLILKGMVCGLRNLNKKDEKWIPFISGMTAGYLSSFFIKQKSTVQTLGCFFLARGFDCYVNSKAKKGEIKHPHILRTLIFGMMLGWVGVLRLHLQEYLSPSLAKFFYFVFQPNNSERNLHAFLYKLTFNSAVKRDLGWK